MKRRVLSLAVAVVVALCATGVIYGQAPPTISDIITNPPALVAGSTASLTLTATVSGNGLLPTSVNLIDLSGGSSAVLMAMLRTGSGTYSTTVNYKTAPSSTARYRISAAFQGSLRRTLTPEIDVATIPKGNPVPTGFLPASPHALMTASDGQPIISNEIIVHLSFDAADPDTTIEKIAHQTGAVVVGSDEDLRIYQLRISTSDPSTADSLSVEISTYPDVESATPGFQASYDNTLVPKDPLWDSWTDNNPSDNNWGFKFVNAPSAWSLTTGSKDVKIGIIDGPFFSLHEDLAANVGSALGSSTASDPDAFHGTLNAGIIGAVGNNGVGVTGMNWTTTLDLYGLLSDFKTPLVIAAMMKRAAQAGDRTVNISLGVVPKTCVTPGNPNPCIDSDEDAEKRANQASSQMSPAIEWATINHRDVLWVISAGNETRDGLTQSPGNLASRYENVLTVGSLSKLGVLLPHSNTGLVVQMAAPGQEIYSTWPYDYKCDPSPDGSRISGPAGYCNLSGTSQAAPFITGTAGLVFSLRPSLTAVQAKKCLLASDRTVSGYPSMRILDAYAAVTCANRPPVAGFSMTAGLQSAADGQTLSLTVTVGNFIDVTFDASSRSVDPNGETISWSWTLDGTPIDFIHGPQRSFTRSLGVGRHAVTLVVANADGIQTGRVTGTILVTHPGVPPNAGFLMTSSGQSATDGRTLDLAVGVGGTINVSFDSSRSSDPNGLSIASWDWQIDGTPITFIRGPQPIFTKAFTAGMHKISLAVTNLNGTVSAPVEAALSIATQTIVNFRFTGIVTTVSDPKNVMGGNVQKGSAVSGTFSYDTRTISSSSSSSTNAVYYFSPTQAAMSISLSTPVGTLTFPENTFYGPLVSDILSSTDVQEFTIYGVGVLPIGPIALAPQNLLLIALARAIQPVTFLTGVGLPAMLDLDLTQDVYYAQASGNSHIAGYFSGYGVSNPSNYLIQFRLTSLTNASGTKEN